MSSPYIGLHSGDSGWSVYPEKVVAATATTEKAGVSITIQKIEYIRRYDRPENGGFVLVEERLPHMDEYAIVLPSGDKLYSRSNPSTLISLVYSRDAEYLDALAEKGILVKKFINSFGFRGWSLIKGGR